MSAPPGLAEAAGLLSKGAAVFFGQKQIIAAFNDSREDVIKSFWGAAYLFPVFLWLVYGLGSDRYAGAEPITRFLAHTLYYIIAWLYWPLAVATISQILGRPNGWARYVVVANWTFSVPFLLLVSALTILGPEAAGLLGGLWIGLQLWAFVIHGWLLQKFFLTSLPFTLILLISDFFISQILQEFEDQIILRSAL